MLVARAEWFIESFLTETLTLEGIAEHCRASPFYLTRAFTARRGMSVMRYVWRRRLSSAAIALANTDQSVLGIALDAGYASHEAFTRAFKAEFRLTPSQVRAQRTTAGLSLTTRPLETAPMPRILSTPRIDTFPERSFIGPSAEYDMQTRSQIPAQWTAYEREGIKPEGTIPDAWYGVCHSFAPEGDRFEYLCGVEVKGAAHVPPGQSQVLAPAGRWLRMSSRAHVSDVGRAWSELYDEWLPELALKLRPSVVIEYYPPEFDGRTGEGGWELWVPVE
jgi:AraC family transcriptional regulator